MASILKKIQKIQQKAAESAGILDYTSIREDLSYVEKEMEKKFKIFIDLKNSIEIYIGTLDKCRKKIGNIPLGKKISPIAEISDQLKKYSEIVRNDPESKEYFDYLAAYSTSFEKLSLAQEEFIRNCKNSILSKLKRIRDIIDRYKKSRKESDNRRLSMDMLARKRSFDPNRDNPDYLKAKNNYKRSIEDLEIILSDFVSAINLIDTEIIFLHTQQLKMYGESYKILEQVPRYTKSANKEKKSNFEKNNLKNNHEKLQTQCPKIISEKSNNKAKYVIAAFDFEPNQNDELKLTKGEKIKLLNSNQSNWWYGENENGKKGLFPFNYVNIIE